MIDDTGREALDDLRDVADLLAGEYGHTDTVHRILASVRVLTGILSRSPERATAGEGEHWPTTPVQCSCGWRHHDAGETWAQHFAALPALVAADDAPRPADDLHC